MKRVETNKDMARLLFASVTRPINAAMAGAGTLFAVAGANHPLGFIGAAMLLATLGLVGRDLSNKEFLQEALGDGGRPKALPEIPESLAGQYRLHCLEAKRHYEKTIEAMEYGGPDISEELRPLREQIMEYVESVYRLAARAHHLDAQLTGSSRNEINKEIEKIRAQMVLTSDAVSRKHLERTREQKEEQLLSYDELALWVKRIQNQMQWINAALENAQFKIMKICSADMKSGSSQADELAQNIQNTLEEVRLFERSLDSAYSEDASMAPAGSLQSWDERAESTKRLSQGPTGPDSTRQLPSGG